MADELVIRDDKLGANIAFTLDGKDNVIAIWIRYDKARPLSDFVNQGAVFRPSPQSPAPVVTGARPTPCGGSSASPSRNGGKANG